MPSSVETTTIGEVADEFIKKKKKKKRKKKGKNDMQHAALG
jgi:hypothetical protein